MKRNCSALLNISLFDYQPETECPPWFVQDNLTGGCSIGPPLDGLIQHNMLTLQTSLMKCYCMTEADSGFSVGACVYTCLSNTPYNSLPCHVSELQNYTCAAGLKRKGHLCSSCADGYGYPVYSYSLACVKCKHYQYNWLKYLAAAYLPLTFFFILVSVFSISFTSPTISGMLLSFQVVLNPTMLQLIHGYTKGQQYRMFLDLGATIASVLTLDFGRAFYSFCLHPSVTAVQIATLDYGVVLYPSILILITHRLVYLHDRNCKPLVWIWGNVKGILKALKRKLRTSTSLVDVFASFLYLSSTRLLYTSMYILIPTRVYQYHKTSDGSGVLTTKLCLYSDPTLLYFSSKHLPYALLALFFLSIFFILPMVLLFIYPLSCFQKFLNKISLNFLILHTFLDVFQGYYKNGTNGTKDYRCFSGFLFFFPFVGYITFFVTKCSFLYLLLSFFTLVYLSLVLVLKPFKRSFHNQVTVLMLIALLAQCCSLIISNTNSISTEYSNVSFGLLVLAVCIPLLYLLVLVCLSVKRLLFSFKRY